MKRKEGKSGKQLNRVGQVLDQQELDDFLEGKPDDTEIPLIAFTGQETVPKKETNIQAGRMLPEAESEIASIGISSEAETEIPTGRKSPGVETEIPSGRMLPAAERKARKVSDADSWISYAGEQGAADDLSVEDRLAEDADSFASVGETAYTESNAYMGEPAFAEPGAIMGESAFVENNAPMGEPAYIEYNAPMGEPAYTGFCAAMGEQAFTESCAIMGDPSPAESYAAMREQNPAAYDASMDGQLRREEEELLRSMESYETMLPAEEAPRRKKKKVRYAFRRAVVAASLLIACMGLGGTYAWFKYIRNRSVYTEEREVMVPYYLYLLNAQSTANFSLQVMNMHPEETKRVVFCVSNEPVDENLKYSVGRVSDFEYELELAYTSNIPLNYHIYSLKKTNSENQDAIVTSYESPVGSGTGSGTETVLEYWEKRKAEGASEATALQPAGNSETRADEFNKSMYGEDYAESDVVNVGGYEFFADDIEPGTKLRLKTTLQPDLVTQYEHHYYLVEIDWDESVTRFNDFLKETDLAYVIVKAKQPQPEIKP